MRMLCCLFLFFSCVLGVSAQSATELFRQAKLEKDSGKQIKLLNQAIQKSSRLAGAFHLRGDAYRGLGKNQQALEDYTKAIQLTPRDAFRYYARGLAYTDTRKYSLAIADFTKAISLRPDYRKFYLSRAEAEMKIEKYDAALKDYKKYLGKRKAPANVAISMATAWLNTYKYDAAERELLRILPQQPQNPEVYFLLGRVYQSRDLHDEAVSYYSKAINRDISLASAYRYRASVFKEMGELDAALDDYTQLVALQPEAIFFNRRGLVYEEKKAFSSAITDYNKAIELSPKWPIAFNNRGYAYLALKQYDLARADFETAMKLDDSMPTPYINLAGTFWLQKKDKKNTYINLDKALKRNFKDFDSLYDTDKKGWMFDGINRTAEFRAVMYK